MQKKNLTVRMNAHKISMRACSKNVNTIKRQKEKKEKTKERDSKVVTFTFNSFSIFFCYEVKKQTFFCKTCLCLFKATLCSL